MPLCLPILTLVDPAQEVDYAGEVVSGVAGGVE